MRGAQCSLVQCSGAVRCGGGVQEVLDGCAGRERWALAGERWGRDVRVATSVGGIILGRPSMDAHTVCV